MMFFIGFVAFCIFLWWLAKRLVGLGKFMDKSISNVLQDRAFSKIRLRQDYEAQMKIKNKEEKIKAIKKANDTGYHAKIKNEIEELTKGSPL